jgi:hypothetical protein
MKVEYRAANLYGVKKKPVQIRIKLQAVHDPASNDVEQAEPITVRERCMFVPGRCSRLGSLKADSFGTRCSTAD